MPLPPDIINGSLFFVGVRRALCCCLVIKVAGVALGRGLQHQGKKERKKERMLFQPEIKAK
jgi:hypothetical protein